MSGQRNDKHDKQNGARNHHAEDYACKTMLEEYVRTLKVIDYYES